MYIVGCIDLSPRPASCEVLSIYGSGYIFKENISNNNFSIYREQLNNKDYNFGISINISNNSKEIGVQYNFSEKDNITKKNIQDRIIFYFITDKYMTNQTMIHYSYENPTDSHGNMITHDEEKEKEKAEKILSDKVKEICSILEVDIVPGSLRFHYTPEKCYS